jgi:hypothetical protein
VIVRCDKIPRCFPFHCNAVSGLCEVRPNALCSSRVSFRVSARRIRAQAIMLYSLPSNDCTTCARCCQCAHPFHAVCVASVASEAGIEVRGYHGLKRRGWMVEMKLSCDAWKPLLIDVQRRWINASMFPLRKTRFYSGTIAPPQSTLRSIFCSVLPTLVRLSDSNTLVTHDLSNNSRNNARTPYSSHRILGSPCYFCTCIGTGGRLRLNFENISCDANINRRFKPRMSPL